MIFSKKTTLKRETLAGTLAGYLQEVCPPSRKLKAESAAIAHKDED